MMAKLKKKSIPLDQYFIHFGKDVGRESVE
jgi:hypothetical protein